MADIISSQVLLEAISVIVASYRYDSPRRFSPFIAMIKSETSMFFKSCHSSLPTQTLRLPFRGPLRKKHLFAIIYLPLFLYRLPECFFFFDSSCIIRCRFY